MARPASRISATLHKKKQQSLWRQVKIVSVIFVVLLALSIWALHTQKARVANIVVSGNIAVQSADISAIAKQDMQKTYVWIIPTNNFFLLSRARISADLLKNIPTLASVDVSFADLNTLRVSVTERQPAALWCAGTTDVAGQCYYMDAGGFVYAPAPNLSGNNFREFFGLLSQDNPVGSYYFTSDFYNSISGFLDTLTTMQFAPKFFVADDAHTYHVVLNGGGTIIFNDSKTFTTDTVDLQALIDNNYATITPKFLCKLDYINLEYENKAIFKMK